MTLPTPLLLFLNAGLFMLPWLKDRLLVTERDLSTGPGLELRPIREWWE